MEESDALSAWTIEKVEFKEHTCLLISYQLVQTPFFLDCEILSEALNGTLRRCHLGHSGYLAVQGPSIQILHGPSRPGRLKDC